MRVIWGRDWPFIRPSARDGMGLASVGRGVSGRIARVCAPWAWAWGRVFVPIARVRWCVSGFASEVRARDTAAENPQYAPMYAPARHGLTVEVQAADTGPRVAGSASQPASVAGGPLRTPAEQGPPGRAIGSGATARVPLRSVVRYSRHHEICIGAFLGAVCTDILCRGGSWPYRWVYRLSRLASFGCLGW